jgi:hypothetical protein
LDQAGFEVARLGSITLMSRIKKINMRNKVIYWIATIWLALGMVSTGAVQLLKERLEPEEWIV